MRTGPGGHRACRVAPIEPNRLFHHVLLLAPVASTHEQARDIMGGQCCQLVHGKGARGVDQAVDREGVLIPSQTGDSAVVANEMQANGCHKALCHGDGEGGLHVEWVAAGEADEGGMAGDPAVVGRQGVCV